MSFPNMRYVVDSGNVYIQAGHGACKKGRLAKNLLIRQNSEGYLYVNFESLCWMVKLPTDDEKRKARYLSHCYKYVTAGPVVKHVPYFCKGNMPDFYKDVDGNLFAEDFNDA